MFCWKQIKNNDFEEHKAECRTHALKNVGNAQARPVSIAKQLQQDSGNKSFYFCDGPT
jgi:hypothetical protein